MKMRFAVGCISLFVLLQACENNQADRLSTDRLQKVSFTSVIDDDVLTRAANAAWEAGDEIGVYMWKSDDKTVQGSNVPYVTRRGDGYFVGNGQVLTYPEDGTEVDFLAYYPYNKGLASYEAYELDVTNQEDQTAIDLMVADNLTKRNNASVTGNLQFRHLLAKLVLNLNAADGSSLEGIRATVLGLKATAVVDLSKTSDAASLQLKDGAATDIPLYINKECTQAEAVLIPQTISGKLKIKLELGGKSKEIETAIENALVGGARYTVNIAVKNAGGVEVDPEAAQYAKWFETPVITKAQLEDKAELAYVNYYFSNGFTDRAGNPLRNYSMLYSKSLKFAYWVAYPFFKNCEGDSGRTNKWGYAPNISTSWQADLSSGFSSGYDRGHQIPSGDRTCDRTTNAATFYYANMTPQRSAMNQGIWATIENNVRGWKSGVDTVFVVTGAIPPAQNIKYNKGVAIPAYYFKAIARRMSSTNSYQTLALTVDNEDGAQQKLMSVADLEKLTGFTFFPGIDSQYKKQVNTFNN